MSIGTDAGTVVEVIVEVVVEDIEVVVEVVEDVEAVLEAVVEAVVPDEVVDVGTSFVVFASLTEASTTTVHHKRGPNGTLSPSARRNTAM